MPVATEATGLRTVDVTLEMWELADVKAKVEALKARIAKKGLTGTVELTHGEPFTVTHKDPLGGWATKVTKVKATLTYTNEIGLGEHTLLAVVDFTAADEPLIFTLDDGTEVGEVDAKRCDHCHVGMTRTKVLIVADADGNHIHLGGTCAKDYLGHDPLNTLILAEGIRPDPDARGNTEVYLPEFVRAAALMTAAFGWAPAREGADATKHLAWKYLHFPHRFADHERERIDAAVVAIDVEAAIEWAKGLAGTEFNDNLGRVARTEFIGEKALGIAAFIPEGFARAEAKRVEREVVEAERAEAGPAPEGKATITGTVAKVATHYNNYGAREVMTVALGNGARVWGTIPAAIYDVEVGDTVTFTATFTHSDRDETFGFFKRPTKAAMVDCEG